MTYNVVIDLEMCRVPKTTESFLALETIQIGAVLLDEEFNILSKFNQYVHPEYGVLDGFIKHLTGINYSQIKKDTAKDFRESVESLIDWIGDKNYKIWTWSANDYHQLSHELKAKKIKTAKIDEFMLEERWIDYQDLFIKKYEFDNPIKLKDALSFGEIDIEGRLHDGLDDALNTASLIHRTEATDFQPYVYKNEDTTTLNISFGEILSKIGVQEMVCVH